MCCVDLAYVTTTAESPADVLHIQVDMVDDERERGMWCIDGDGGGGQEEEEEDVSTVATRLRHLDDIGNREDFHRQVGSFMISQHFKKSPTFVVSLVNTVLQCYELNVS